MKLFAILVSMTAVLTACQSSGGFNAEEEKAKILAMQAQERKAHFDRNTELFVSEFGDTVIFVNKGKVSFRSLAENRERIASYFQNVEFLKWDDTATPLIEFSDDGSMAYAVIQKQVIVANRDSSGKAFPDTTNYAWTSIYQKQKGEWKLACNSSTEK